MSKCIVFVLFLAACINALPTQSSIGRGTDRVGNLRLSSNTAAYGDYPFMVTLRYPNDILLSCTGTILNRNWILTAASCVVGIDISDVDIAVGSDAMTFNPRVRRKACKIRIHPKFSGTKYYLNDIAMILVTEPFKYGKDVAPVAIYCGVTRSNLNVTVVGWRLNNGPPSRVYEFTTRSDCSRVAIKNQICVKFPKQTVSCSEDSGSPLLHTNSKAQLGIASFDKEKCHVEDRVMYTRVALYVGWMEEVIHSTKLTCA
ncbi:hypothetical protein Trydic_g12379 [Trypoxylus dichotomus]